MPDADRLLIAGDVLFNMHLLTTAPGLREPPRPFTTDPALNRRSIRRIAATVCGAATSQLAAKARSPTRIERSPTT